MTRRCARTSALLGATLLGQGLVSLGARLERQREQPAAQPVRQLRSPARLRPRRLGGASCSCWSARGMDERGYARLALAFGVFYTGLAGARPGRPPPARPAARPGRERLPPHRRADHARARRGRACGCGSGDRRDALRRRGRPCWPRWPSSRRSSAGCRARSSCGPASPCSWSGRCSAPPTRCGRCGGSGSRRSTSSCSRSLAVVTGLGTSLGYHRLLTHRSFRTTPWIRPRGARRRRDGGAEPADRLGRPPPRAPRPRRSRGRPAQPGRRPPARARRLDLRASSPAKRERYCRRLMDDPVVMAIDRTAVALARARAGGAGADRRLARAALGRASCASPIHNHTMFAVNSICHAFGSQPFDDRRREPQQPADRRCSRSARAGTTTTTPSRRRPTTAWAAGPDVTGLVIRGLERSGLAWDVHRPHPAAVARRRLPARPADGPDHPIRVIAAFRGVRT